MAGSRYDLTDFEWSVIKEVLPHKGRGAPRVDDRRILNGTFWVLRSGVPCTLAGFARALRAVHDGLQPFQSLA